MPRYHFQVNSSEGVKLSGAAWSESSRELQAYLRSLGFGEAKILRFEGFHWPWPENSVRGQARIVLLRQLSFSFQSGISVVDTLFGMRAQHTGPAVAGLATMMGHSLGAGLPLSRCCARFPRDFPPIVTGMLAAAEVSGALGPTLERCAELLEDQQELSQRLRSVMIYPACITLIFTLVLSIFTLYVVPIFVEVFSSFGVQPPLPLSAIAALSGILGDGWALVFALQGLAALGIWTFGWLRSASGREVFLKYVHDLPVVSTLYRDYLVTQFCLMMKEMLRVGVDLVKALETCRDSSEGELRASLEVALAEIVNGEPLSAALRSHGFLPRLVSQLVAAGEETGKLVAMFDSLYKYHQQSFRYRVETMLSLLEPLIIGVMGLMVAGFVISMAGPMFNLFQVVGG